MDANEFNAQIRAACDLINRLEVSRIVSWTRSLSVSAAFRAVALDDLASYETIYKAGLTLSHYNVLLKDYSYFQFTHTSQDSWRLAFLPNPWLSGVSSAMDELSQWEEAEAEGFLSDEDVSMLMDGMAYECRIPPIRFEYAQAQYKELSHPAAHFHIGRHYENRWPSALKLGPRVFVMLVLKMYYPERWGPLSRFASGVGEGECLDAALIQAAGRDAAVHDFSENERQSPHFGRNLVALPPPPAPERDKRAKRR